MTRQNDSFPTIDIYAQKVGGHFAMLAKYLGDAKSNYQTVSRELHRQITSNSPSSSWHELHPCNAAARIHFARVLLRAVIGGVRRNASPYFFVTLTPNLFALSEADAQNFDASELKAWIERHLPGVNFIGMIEPAYFPSSGLGPALISWHAHGIVWGISYSQLNNLFKAIRSRHRSITPGVHAATTERIGMDQIVEKVLYFAKPPRKKYSRFAHTIEVVDADGEIRRRPTGRYGQKKDTLRPGEAVRMCRVLERQTLDGLLVGLGEGRSIVTRVSRQALAPFHRRTFNGNGA